MKRIFAVIRERGSAWQASLPLESQQAWNEHASLMDGMVEEGFISLGGPLEGTSDVLLIVRAGDPGEIERRFADDPWTKLGLLRTTRIAPWTLRLGALP